MIHVTRSPVCGLELPERLGPVMPSPSPSGHGEVMSLPFERPGSQVLRRSLLPPAPSPFDVDWHRPEFSECKNIKT